MGFISGSLIGRSLTDCSCVGRDPITSSLINADLRVG